MFRIISVFHKTLTTWGPVTLQKEPFTPSPAVVVPLGGGGAAAVVSGIVGQINLFHC